MKTYLVAGATGFVGAELVPALEARGARVVRLVRAVSAEHVADVADDGRRAAPPDDLEAGDDFTRIDAAWPAGFTPDCVFHLAARVHVMRDTASDPLAAFRAVNVEATLRVARAAARAGVRRFVYVSSIKALGEDSDPGRALRESDPARPDDPYGISKREAELALFELGRQTGMEIVVIRPPLVYGPGVGANFLSLFRAVARGLPLPLGAASAPRSLVAVENLVSAMLACAEHPAASGEIFHVSDGHDVSVAELIELMAAALGRRARLVAIPASMLRLAGRVTGRGEAVRRLIDPLRLDIGKLRERLGWTPPATVQTALSRTAAWYRSDFPH
ncbi:NAD-dependent epimerase/dehydratase family protein [Pararobbsia silviterrae]|uniref:NAD-dependent epimerase/dehydratase family protein n=1 Tax=Pararobbsia silviterrae TaxID=1792498 RepID=A0A494YHB9_9BURK|nr:NAD-dependent epimerase/dehydratase family protein [Pararobbsia silviterrae]RKP59417.1 NAD-dependent epimerase/dehydratase family protein [Pararobbsia silviterrae]